MATCCQDDACKKLRVFFVPFFATSHIAPMTDLACHLVAARPDVIEATMVVTPANAAIVRSSTLARSSTAATTVVGILTYPFPAVDGLRPGIENLGSAPAKEAWRIDRMAVDLPRPAQEALLREHRPDVVVSDIHFWWNTDIAAGLGIPCITFHAIGTFSTLAMHTLFQERCSIQQASSEAVVTVPGFPGPEIRIPKSELPDFLVQEENYLSVGAGDRLWSARRRSFGVVVNTFRELEPDYCEVYTQLTHAKRAYFVGPVALPHGAEPQIDATQLAQRGGVADVACLKWLDTKPRQSVVYVCFGSYAQVSSPQLMELASGLEASGKLFLWVVRGEDTAGEQSPFPEGWEKRIDGSTRGMVVRGWAPQVAILAHPAIGAFMTHCGWNSVLEAATAGVPMLTCPLVFDMFIIERLVVGVLRVGKRVWEGGKRSTREAERETVPADAIASAVSQFMEPGGEGDEARVRAKELAVKARSAVARGGSSYCDLHRLIEELMEARSARGNIYS